MYIRDVAVMSHSAGSAKRNGLTRSGSALAPSAEPRQRMK